MKKSKFTEAQIVFAIKQFETGTRVERNFVFCYIPTENQ